MSFDIQSLYRLVFKIWRKRRFQLFLRVMKPKPTDVMLDVGGYPVFWLANPQPVQRIDALNVHPVAWDSQSAPEHRIQTLVGDGCELPFADASYDLGFSNSVIEHVGEWDAQQRFAAEIRRVGRALWVQTPAFECPIEPHYMTPFIHYLPRSWQKKVLRWFSVWGWVARPTKEQIAAAVESTRLLRKSEMRQLFPDCEILTERMLWILPKSYIAIRHEPSKAAPSAPVASSTS